MYNSWTTLLAWFGDGVLDLIVHVLFSHELGSVSYLIAHVLMSQRKGHGACCECTDLQKNRRLKIGGESSIHDQVEKFWFGLGQAWFSLPDLILRFKII